MLIKNPLAPRPFYNRINYNTRNNNNRRKFSHLRDAHFFLNQDIFGMPVARSVIGATNLGLPVVHEPKSWGVLPLSALCFAPRLPPDPPLLLGWEGRVGHGGAKGTGTATSASIWHTEAETEGKGRRGWVKEKIPKILG